MSAILHQSLTEPVLVSGAERNYTIMSGTIAALLVFSGKSLFSLFIGLVFWKVSMMIGRILAKKNPQIIQMYIRHMRYKIFYPAVEKLKIE